MSAAEPTPLKPPISSQDRCYTVVSMTGSDEAHLKQRQLDEIEGINDILDSLGEWIASADFGKEEKGIQLCVDKGLPKASQPLLTATGFQNTINSNNIKFNVLRIRGTKYPMKPRRAADLIPINLWEGNAATSDKNLTLGTITHITKGVVIEVEEGATLDLLFVIEK